MFAQEEIDDHVAATWKVARDILEEGHTVGLATFIFCTEDPLTGDPGRGIVPGVETGQLDERNALLAVWRAIAIAGKASHVILVQDTWMVKVPKVEGQGFPGLGCAPSEHPDREESLLITIEHADGARNERLPYVRDQGRIIFGEMEITELKHEQRKGRLRIMGVGEPPAVVKMAARNLAKLTLRREEPIKPQASV